MFKADEIVFRRLEYLKGFGHKRGIGAAKVADALPLGSG
jgi:hypothetical protein